MAIMLGVIIIKCYDDEQYIKELEITEVCTHNENVIYDNEGIYYDYVELHNISSETINLSEYFLSDSNWRLTKYSLDEMEIEPGQYQLVFIDKEEAGFSIANEEVIYLSHQNRGIIDSVVLPEIEMDMSYAKSVEGECWENNQQPTPYYENVVSGAEPELVEDTSLELLFSCGSGFYQEEFYLEMTTTEGCDIFYTLDSSEPTQDSLC